MFSTLSPPFYLSSSIFLVSLFFCFHSFLSITFLYQNLTTFSEFYINDLHFIRIVMTVCWSPKWRIRHKILFLAAYERFTVQMTNAMLSTAATAFPALSAKFGSFFLIVRTFLFSSNFFNVSAVLAVKIVNYDCVVIDSEP